jgi:putative membrane protein
MDTGPHDPAGPMRAAFARHTIPTESRMNRMFRLALAALLCAVPLLAVGQTDLGDAQIAHVVVTASQVDVDAGKLARTKSAGKDTRAFAERMIADHNAVNKEAAALAKRLGIKPEDNPISRSLHQGGRDNLANLRGLNRGATFDRAYIAHEIAYHEAVLDMLDKTLLPGARTAELKALLDKARPVFAAHLEHARQLQAAIGR